MLELELCCSVNNDINVQMCVCIVIMFNIIIYNVLHYVQEEMFKKKALFSLNRQLIDGDRIGSRDLVIIKVLTNYTMKKASLINFTSLVPYTHLSYSFKRPHLLQLTFACLKRVFKCPIFYCCHLYLQI